jgi:hypothetical protein
MFKMWPMQSDQWQQHDPDAEAAENSSMLGEWAHLSV